MKLPKTRTTGILEQEADGELMIYDLQIDKAYALNETSRIVYKSCTGKMTFEDLRSRYKFTDDLIYLTLDELVLSNLIENYQSNHFVGLSRREIIKKVGLATMAALPVIVAISAPSAATAASLTVCQRTNCFGGSAQCNNAPGCGALAANFVCCSGSGACTCVPDFVCLQSGGSICPRPPAR